MNIVLPYVCMNIFHQGKESCYSRSRMGRASWAFERMRGRGMNLSYYVIVCYKKYAMIHRNVFLLFIVMFFLSGGIGFRILCNLYLASCMQLTRLQARGRVLFYDIVTCCRVWGVI